MEGILKNQKQFYFILVATVCLHLGLWARADIKPKVVYGDDNRIEIYEAPLEWQNLADSTVALVFSQDLQDMEDGRVRVAQDIYSTSKNLCPEAEPNFRNQNSLAFCSGSLIAPNIVLTAGHCITTQSGSGSWGGIACDQVQMVFNFGYKTKNQDLDYLSNQDVYSCKKLIYREQKNNGADFALVYLDRPVTNHIPLTLNWEGKKQVGDPLVVIGHPVGIPTKIAAGARIRSFADGYFVSNLDTFGGNSGSAVLNEKTGWVEGVLVRGQSDFKKDYQRNCNVVNRCSDDGCRGEDSTDITAVLSHIPPLSLAIE